MEFCIKITEVFAYTTKNEDELSSDSNEETDSALKTILKRLPKFSVKSE